jgi:hypothetical protein
VETGTGPGSALALSRTVGSFSAVLCFSAIWAAYALRRFANGLKVVASCSARAGLFQDSGKRSADGRAGVAAVGLVDNASNSIRHALYLSAASRAISSSSSCWFLRISAMVRSRRDPDAPVSSGS